MTDPSRPATPDRPDTPGGSPVPRDPRASLPQVDLVVQDPALEPAIRRAGRRVVVAAVRDELAGWRDRLTPPAETAEATEGEDAAAVPSVTRIVGEVLRRLDATAHDALVPVINATGVVLHTNLGRAPLSAAAREAVLAATGYSSLELDLHTGERGSRTAHVGTLAAHACGTPAATVVNNGAGALLLVLAALAHGREVVVSRGELVEIGGSYRLPDVMAAAGVRLVEVGTTNRTRLADHRDAVGPATGLLLKVHRSNFAQVGFTEDASLAELVELGRGADVPVVHDLGSGALHDATSGPLRDEPSVAASVRAGADLVVFSGDKLLGGPQAGIIAGRADLVAACRRHALARALRIDGLQRAALEATLTSHLRDPAPADVPVVAMLATSPEVLHGRAVRIAEALGDGAEVRATQARIGGGSAPTGDLPSWAVALPDTDGALARSLRTADPVVVGRSHDGELLLDLRAVPPAGDTSLTDRVRAARSEARRVSGPAR